MTGTACSGGVSRFASLPGNTRCAAEEVDPSSFPQVFPMPPTPCTGSSLKKGRLGAIMEKAGSVWLGRF